MRERILRAGNRGGKSRQGPPFRRQIDRAACRCAVAPLTVVPLNGLARVVRVVDAPRGEPCCQQTNHSLELVLTPPRHRAQSPMVLKPVVAPNKKTGVGSYV